MNYGMSPTPESEGSSLTDARGAILGMTNSIAQRYAFARYVLGEDRLTAAAIAGHFQGEPMDAKEFDLIVAGWSI